ncbi:phospholipid/cholesterol/gamma-HCH transport system permease protein [Herbihabitans rhizosphaerae]|uniref:Phospholipid/cholesterol/gamma-HCH transport system permease protein n=1 Tax=Herbihabitans rhizosphaerae TaxID=1872711 RepID=A0A4Q7KCK8_9PSEU|nr:ABC transporter permease [Herbihabitans rhizosphaerae]RZS31228.1 phospholipid/cholesterol/gamma-HCH transport system permease protein [Herbihabitans rhizosphaerae]
MIKMLAETGRQFTFYVKVIAAVPRSLVRYWRHIVRLIAEVSFGSATLLAGGGTIGVVFAMSFVSGSQIGLEGFRGLDLVSLSPLSGSMSALVNTRELAPIVAGLTLAAKVGTGFTAQLGAMRISEEIDALDAMSIRSLPFLVTTRMIAAFFTVIPLYLVGLFASYVATRLVVVDLNGQSGGNYDYYFSLVLPPQDVLFSLLKALVLAMVVTMVHCYYGYTATGGPEGVGRAAGRALRTSIVLIMIVDVLLTFAFWGIHQELPGTGGGR